MLGLIVKTVKRLFFLTPEQGAETVVWLPTSDEPAGKTGFYFHLKKEDKVAAIASNDDYARILWEESCKWGNMTEHTNA